MQSWLEGRIWVGKGSQATEMTASLRILSSKADSNTCESFTRSGLKLESVHQESPRSDVFRKRATWTRDNVRSVLPGLWRKRTGLLLSGPKSSFQMKVNFAFHLEIKVRGRVWRKSGEAQNSCCLKSSVKFPQSVMIWAAMSSAGVGPLCFLKSTVNAAIYQDILEHYMLPSAVLLCLIGQQIRWIENLWGIVKRKMRDTRRNNADDLKAAIKATWASIPPQQCHKLITSMPCRIEAVIKAKGAPTKYWVHIE